MAERARLGLFGSLKFRSNARCLRNSSERNLTPARVLAVSLAATELMPLRVRSRAPSCEVGRLLTPSNVALLSLH